MALKCPSCSRSIFSARQIVIGLENGVVFNLEACQHFRCIYDGTDWLVDFTIPGKPAIVPLAGRDSARLIGECRKREWDDQFLSGAAEPVTEANALVRPEEKP